MYSFEIKRNRKRERKYFSVLISFELQTKQNSINNEFLFILKEQLTLVLFDLFKKSSKRKTRIFKKIIAQNDYYSNAVHFADIYSSILK